MVYRKHIHLARILIDIIWALKNKACIVIHAYCEMYENLSAMNDQQMNNYKACYL